MNIERLPVWARDHIAQLTHERNKAIATLKEFQDSQTKSDISYEKFDPKNTVVKYIQSDRIKIELGNSTIEVSKTGSILRVSSIGLSESLRVQPECSNVINIWSERHRHE